VSGVAYTVSTVVSTSPDGGQNTKAALSDMITHVAATATRLRPRQTPFHHRSRRVPKLYETRLHSTPARLLRVSALTWVFSASLKHSSGPEASFEADSDLRAEPTSAEHPPDQESDSIVDRPSPATAALQRCAEVYPKICSEVEALVTRAHAVVAACLTSAL
jgi:hypothetical protein